MRVAHTGALECPTLLAPRRLRGDAFAGEMTDADWEHALGGMHALVWEQGELIAHGSLIQRRLIHRGRALRTGYVEGVAVRTDRRRRGHGGAIMEALEDVARRAYDLAALAATDDGRALYAARGWQRWNGPTAALTPEGVRRTPDADGAVFVLPVAAEPDLSGSLICDWRDGDVW